MSIHKLKPISTAGFPKALKWDEPVSALQRWNPEIKAATDAGISIYGRIGEDWDGSGVTAQRIGAALRAIGEKDVVVSINSPGGDFFEGVAIYNLLREHKNKVTVKVVGLAASAASVIAMAADELQIAKSGFLMIHNSWAIVMGNRKDMEESAAVLEKFDSAMADVYVERSGMEKEEIEEMMDAETWLSATDAIDMGLADSVVEGDDVVKEKQKKNANALRELKILTASTDGRSMNKAQRMVREIADHFKELVAAEINSQLTGESSTHDNQLNADLDDVVALKNSVVPFFSRRH